MKLKRFPADGDGKTEKVSALRTDEGCEDIELRKLYPQLPDAKAATSGYVRVVDESGEDHLYPARLFVPVELTSAAKRAVAGTLRRRTAA
jgi:hypothetical protein